MKKTYDFDKAPIVNSTSSTVHMPYTETLDISIQFTDKRAAWEAFLLIKEQLETNAEFALRFPARLQ